MTSWLWGACSTEVLYSLPKLNRYFFVLLVCHLSVIDGFDWHFHISVHFTLSSSINRSQQHWKIQEINLPEVQKLNQGLLGEKQVRYLCAMQISQFKGDLMLMLLSFRQSVFMWKRLIFQMFAPYAWTSNLSHSSFPQKQFALILSKRQ